MNNNKEKKKFALIELISGIIVLIAVLIILMSKIVPLLYSTTDDVVVENNEALEDEETEDDPTINELLKITDTLATLTATVTLYDDLQGNDYNCYSLQYFIDNGYLVDIQHAEDITTKEGYSGYVLLNKSDADYTITIMLNDHTNQVAFSAEYESNNLIYSDATYSINESTFSCPADTNFIS
ncbi:MAG: hypothetical protein R3Y13_02315 [bacterium]